MAVLSESIQKYTSYDYELTEFTLATGVGRICSMRGWIPAQAGHTQDQGLIVAYLKSGVAYYRNYCLQSDGTTYIWESEQQITELPTGLTDIALFRTNDFRVGVLGRDSSGNVHMTVTVRNYTGMSLYPEIATLGIVDIGVNYIPITFTQTQITETATLDFARESIDYCHISVPDPVVTATREGTDKVIIEGNLTLWNYVGTENQYTLTTDFETLTVTGVAAGTTSDKLEITFSETVDPSLDITISHPEWGDLRTYATEQCRRYVRAFTIIAEGQPPVGYAEETATLEFTDLEVDYIPITFSQGYETETATLEIVDMTIVMMNLNGDPV